MSELPEPLTPADCNLTDFAFMPLEIARLKQSKQWLIAKRRPEVGFYAINLWAAAWHQRPAASIENDDDVLADAAGCPPEKWPGVRDDVMRGWVRCADGRLYHPVVAQKALESWRSKLSQHHKRACERARKAKKPQPHLIDFLHQSFPESAEMADTLFPAESAQRSGGKRRKARKLPAENALNGKGQGKVSEEKVSAAPDARRFLAELRKTLSPTGNQRTKPKDCDTLLPPLITKHGFDPLLAAAKAFYSTPDAQKDDGRFQCGVQVALRDGRIEAIIVPPEERAAERRKWVMRFANGDIDDWSAAIIAKVGGAPTQDEIAAIASASGEDLFSGGPAQ